MSFSLNTTGGVASRFVSQSDLDEAKANKDKEWKAAYARIGEEPPPRPQEEEYDPRSLFEKLQHNKDVKREQWDEKMKMGNQFRGLDSEEVNFLEATQREHQQAEAAKRKEEQDILNAFRQAQQREPSPPPSLVGRPGSSKHTPSSSSSTLPKSKAKPKLKGLPPGVIVKKKPAAAAKATPATPSSLPPLSAPLNPTLLATTASKPVPSTSSTPASLTAAPTEITKKRPLPGLDVGSRSESDEAEEADSVKRAKAD